MIRIPLRYSHRVFGEALIDDDMEPLAGLGYYSVTLPKVLRATAARRPDVILALLIEDLSTRMKVTPFVSLFGTQILLVHMVLKGELGRLVVEQAQRSYVGDTFVLRSDINMLRSSIGRISYTNKDRTDCRSENLREL